MTKNWDQDKIRKWNMYRFPTNKTLDQIKKIEGEIKEFKTAVGYGNKQEELADVYIACAGLSRFSSLGSFVCDVFESMPDFYKLQSIINLKMEINSLRKFDEDMHHIEEEPEKDSIKVTGFDNPEYVNITKNFHYWKKGENGKWRRVSEPFTFTVIKSDYYRYGEE